MLAALALVIGLVIGLRGSPSQLSPAIALVPLVVGAAALLSDRRDLLVATSFAGVVLAGLLLGNGEYQRSRGDCRRGWKAGQPVRVTALAIGYLPAGVRGSVRVRPLSPAESPCAWVGPLRVWADGPVRPGGSYSVRGSWRGAGTVTRGPRPPERWGWVAADEIELIAAENRREHPFLAARGGLAEKLWRVYPRRWAPLAQALVLGQRETLDPAVARRIGRAGLAHLLAISGLHVGMLAGAFFFLARAARLSVQVAHLTTLALSFTYVLLIGAPASSVRAVVMVLFWTLTRLAGRASSPYDVLGLTALLLLLVRPWSVLEPGFQLSFAGAVAIGYAHTEARRIPWLSGRSGILRAVALSIVTSVAAVLLTGPITAVHFGRVVPAAILGNLLAVPLLGLAMPPLFLSALTSPWPAAASWPASAAVVLLAAIDLIARLLGSARWAAIDVATPSLLPVLAYVAVLVLGAQAFHGAWRRRRFILALGLAWSVAIAWPPVGARFGSGRVGVFVLDVGQGDAIAVRTPGRRWLLIDAGPNIAGFDAGERRVVPFLRSRGVRRLEAWLATHPDLDHVGGGPAVLKAVDVERVIGVGRVTGQVGQVALLRRLAADSVRWLRATVGAQLSVDGLELAFLHPDVDAGRDLSAAANEQSLVFRLQYGRFRMLFTGDVPSEVEDRLARERVSEIRAQVLKIAHHGSATSTSLKLLRAVQPQLAVISVGRGNRYGHPAPQVLNRLAVRGIEVRRTDRDGMLVIEADRDGSFEVRSSAEVDW